MHQCQLKQNYHETKSIPLLVSSESCLDFLTAEVEEVLLGSFSTSTSSAIAVERRLLPIADDDDEEDEDDEEEAGSDDDEPRGAGVANKLAFDGVDAAGAADDEEEVAERVGRPVAVDGVPLVKMWLFSSKSANSRRAKVPGPFVILEVRLCAVCSHEGESDEADDDFLDRLGEDDEAEAAAAEAAASSSAQTGQIPESTLVSAAPRRELRGLNEDSLAEMPGAGDAEGWRSWSCKRAANS
jgi:hypothetical protein